MNKLLTVLYFYEMKTVLQSEHESHHFSASWCEIPLEGEIDPKLKIPWQLQFSKWSFSDSIWNNTQTFKNGLYKLVFITTNYSVDEKCILQHHQNDNIFNMPFEVHLPQKIIAYTNCIMPKLLLIKSV